MLVDAHHHLWDPAVVEYAWLGPELARIRRPFRRSQLEPLLEAHGIRATVVVQAGNTDEDTAYLLRESDGCDWIAAVVGWVDLRRPGAVRERVDPEGRHPKLRGVRNLLDDEPSDWVDATVLRSLEIVADASLALDVPALFPRHLETIPDLARRLERLTIVLDHLGSPLAGHHDFARWARELEAAAAMPNVYAKLSGLRTVGSDTPPSPAIVARYVEHALAVFGAERLMWGSDWPVSLLVGDYASSWRTVAEAVNGCSTDERNAIFGGTATRVYGIGAAIASAAGVSADV